MFARKYSLLLSKKKSLKQIVVVTAVFVCSLYRNYYTNYTFPRTSACLHCMIEEECINIRVHPLPLNCRSTHYDGEKNIFEKFSRITIVC